MANDFASRLADRIKSHPEFWEELSRLQVAGVRSTMADLAAPAENGHPRGQHQTARLLYSASVFSQTADEHNKALAQTIALNALLAADPDPALRERIIAILSQVGNFPSIQFLEDLNPQEPSTFLSSLKLGLLKAINTVKIGTIDRPLTDFQYDTWSDLPHLHVASVSAPTSSGKSFLLIEYLARKSIAEGHFTAVYIVPTRALLAEVQRKIAARIQGMPDIRLSTVPSLDPEARSKQIFVLTQERLHVLMAIADLRVDLLVVDEAQGISDGPRGMILQDCLDRLKESNPTMQLFLLSPGAIGFESVAQLLGYRSMEPRDSNLSPVLQNRILVDAVDGNPRRLSLKLIGARGLLPLGEIQTDRGLADPGTRLAACALELGRAGAALVYATGPVEAETIAKQIASDLPVSILPATETLSQFIREHIHPEYGLAAMVKHGVTFHYGKMPTLLREALESAFRTGALKYVVCTTTLFQGVNLPARSVFINTPTRGKGVSLDPAHLWNFAGRAGRLGQDLVGNVFLIDYEQWKEKPMSEPAKFRVRPALATTIEENFDVVSAAVRGAMPKLSVRDPTAASVRAAAGLLLSRAASDRSTTLLERMGNLTPNQRLHLAAVSRAAAHSLEVPRSVLNNNWTVDPYGLQRLAQRMRVKISEGSTDELIPLHPRDNRAFKRYVGVFNRAARELLGYKAHQFGVLVASYAVPWMQGQPYPVIVNQWVRYARERNPNAKINDLVRKAFEFIEDTLRFQMVQIGKAYLDVLSAVFDEAGLSHRKAEVFDYALALELGVSSTSGRAFVELGTSRITALALEALFPNSELTATEARTRLRELDVVAVGLSPIIVSELRELRLIAPELNTSA